MLLVLVGGVMSANADGIEGSLLMPSSLNSWAISGDNVITFEKINNYEFTITLLKTDYPTIANTDLEFKLYVGEWESKWVGPWTADEGGNILSTTANNTVNTNSAPNFLISKIGNDAIGVQIYVKWTYHENYNDNKWQFAVTAAKIEKEYTIAFVNNDWSQVQCYSWANDHYFLRAWPGETLSGTNGVYVKKFYANSDAKVIFNNKVNNEGVQTSDLALVDNGVYNASGLVGNQTIALSNDFGTYSSDYPLTFPEGDQDIQAYTATYNSGTGKIQMSRVTGVVPAKTGLFLAKKISGNASIQVAPCATVSAAVSGNQMKPGTGVVPSGENCYALVKRTVGESVTYGFVKITESPEIPVGKAYLDASSAYAPELGFFMDDDETTTIYSLGIEQNDVENGVMYNLAGQRVEQPTKGVYILNGKKVIIK